MPDFTIEKPHAITCIKRSVQELLERHCGNGLTVSCDRTDCWADEELFKWRQAVNIASDGDSIGSPVKSPKVSRKLGEPRTQADSVCWYDATLSLRIEIYVQSCDGNDCCDNARDNALSILAHISSTLYAYKNELLGNRLLYRGSSHSEYTEGEIDLALVTANFDIEYLFDPTRPWLAQQK